MTRSSTTYSRGDVVIVPFAFSDRDAFKNRPALIVSSDSFHQARNEVIVAAMTTRVREPLLAGDYRLVDWQACGLPKPTIVTGILRTAKAYLIARKLGEVSASEMEAIDSQLRRVLAL